MKKSKAAVAIIMGSQSDWTIMKDAATALEEFGIKCLVEIVSAHRTPKKLFEFASKAEDKGFSIIIAGAGGAAHLPGMTAAFTILPVIGVPVAQGASSGHLDGLDALLSISQMPKGVPVTTVGINQAWNAGLVAVQILAVNDEKLKAKLRKQKKMLEKKVLMSKLKSKV